MSLADLRDCRSAEFQGYGTIPWWSWNGDMEYAEMRRQLGLMKEGGVDGWMLFPRFGLEMPYLGHEYMTKVRFAVEESARLGLEVWLYDEYAWPSGNAQCQVGEVNPEFRWRVLSTFTYDLEGGKEYTLDPDWGRTGHIRKPGKMSGENPESDSIHTVEEAPISYLQQSRDAEGNRLFFHPRLERAVAVPLRDGQAIVEEAICINDSVHDLTVRWTPPQGMWRVYVLISRDYGVLIDHLNPDAVQTFIRLTHEKYEQYVGDYFGTTVKGFFSDETRMFRDTSHRFLEPTIVWTKDMFGRLERAGLNEIDAAMAAVFEEGDSPAMRRLRLAFWDRITDFYADAFYKPICAWAEAHGMIYSGDCFSEDRSVTPYLGDYFKCMKPYHMPGFDSLGLCNWQAKEDYKSPKFASSVAHQCGEAARCVSEGPGLLSWRVTLEELRRTSDWLYAFGANRLVPNSFLYTLNHEQLYVSPSYFFHWTMWQHFRDWDGYLRRLGYVLTRGAHVAPVAFLYPTETLLSGFRPVIPGGGRQWQTSPETDRCYRDVVNAAYGLLCRQIDFDYVDSAWLEDQDVSSGAVIVGEARQRVIVIAGHHVLRQATVRKIQEFVKSGGHVVWVGDVRVLDEGGKALNEFADWLKSDGRCAVVEGTDDQVKLEEAIVAAMEKFIELPVRLTGLHARRCAVNMRRDAHEEYLYIACNSEETHEVNVQVAGWDGMESCDLLTGHWHPTAARNGQLLYPFAPHESILLRKSIAGQVETPRELPLHDKWAVEVKDLNFHVPEPVSVTTRWGARQGWEAVLCYISEFEVEVSGPLERCLLVLDDVEYLSRKNRMNVTVSETKLAFHPCSVVDPLWVEADVTGALVNGRNHFTVEYRHTDYDSFDNLFTKRRSPAPQIRPRLVGRFLVKDNVLHRLPETLGELPAGDLVPQGLAFYSGRVVYRQNFTLPQKARLAGVEIKELAHQAIVRIDGTEAGRILWRPFRCHCERELDAGEHVIELEVTNTQANQMFEEARAFGLMGEVALLLHKTR